MIEQAIAAVENAARAAAAGGMTTGLRDYAAYMGWDPRIARTLKVEYTEGEFVASSPVEGALDMEFGSTSGSSPKPAIRTYDSKGLAAGRLREALDKVAEEVL